MAPSVAHRAGAWQIAGCLLLALAPLPGLAGRPVYTLPVVVGIMVFFALCMQCGATVAIIARELDWRWAALSFFGMTFLAWLAAVAIFQIGSLL